MHAPSVPILGLIGWGWLAVPGGAYGVTVGRFDLVPTRYACPCPHDYGEGCIPCACMVYRCVALGYTGRGG